jgi:hypothetical protein
VIVLLKGIVVVSLRLPFIDFHQWITSLWSVIPLGEFHQCLSKGIVVVSLRLPFIDFHQSLSKVRHAYFLLFSFSSAYKSTRFARSGLSVVFVLKQASTKSSTHPIHFVACS